MEALDNEDISEITKSPLKIKERVLVKLFSLIKEKNVNLNSDLIQVKDGRIYHVLLIKSQEGMYVLKFSKPLFHQLAYKEIKKMRYFRERGVNVIPKIYADGFLGNETTYLVQEHRVGEPIGTVQPRVSNLDFSALGSELSLLHIIEASGSTWGEPLNDDCGWGEYENFGEYINAQFISKVDGCSFLTDQEKQLLKKGIQKLLSSVRKQERKAHLVHGDCHPKNIIVNDAGESHLIDFGGLHYALPESDFARMMHYSSMDGYIPDITSTYQKKTGIILDPKMIDLFFLCRGIKLEMKDERKAKEFWGKLKLILDCY